MPLRRPGERGFLQLCADRRYHRNTMLAFEELTGLGFDDYWIEAAAGGAPASVARTRTADYAYEHGAVHMGWAAHGDGCGGFPGLPDEQLLEMLHRTVARRASEFPNARHYALFGVGGRVRPLDA